MSFLIALVIYGFVFAGVIDFLGKKEQLKRRSKYLE